MHITFLGAAGTVTGSKYLVRAGRTRLLVDCGLFQGFKQLRLRNWAPLPIDPAAVDMVALTHSHLDHSGYIPLLVRHGFKGPVLCTEPTRDLCGLLLPDSGFLHEQDAEYANRHGFSKHRPALPLYTLKDAEAAMAHFRTVEFGAWHRLGKNLSLRFLPAGHILGAAMIELSYRGVTILFSGDLGRPGSATMPDPMVVRRADYLVLESTYGDRRHEKRDPEDALADVINRTAARGGVVLVPSFTVGRAQTLLYHLWRLKTARRIPDMPIYLDSPMAIDASELFCKHAAFNRLSPEECRAACSVARYVRSPEESEKLDRNPMPAIIISASGMATGGRVLHHLKHFAPDPRNTVLFTGFQAGGTRGAAMTGGAERIKIHGGYVPVRAEVDNLHMLSAHADADEIMAWLRNFERPPVMTYLTHGEPAAADALRLRIAEELGWSCWVPDHCEAVALD
ncbi:MAG TPA: MBL fold metallo-hydrolase [Alphaproteobacteria bacterium]